MKRNAMRRNLRQSIIKTFGRYIAIAAIIALGAGLFVGLLMTKADMVATGQMFMDKQNMFDLRLINRYGWTEDYLEEIAKVDGIVDMEPVTYIDLIAHVGDAQEDSVYRFLTIPQRVNLVDLRGGRMPQAENECLACGFHMDEGILGQTVTISENNEEDALEGVKQRTYTIVGYVATPLYMDMNRGTTTVGSGSLADIFYVPQDALDLDYFPEVNITLDGDYKIYTDAYADAMEEAADAMEAQLQILADRRLEEVRAEAMEEYQDGLQEYADGLMEYAEGKAEADKELADAYQELLDAEEEIADSEDLLKEGEQQIADGRVSLAESEKTLAASRQTFAEAKAEAYEQIAEANQELLKNYKTINENMQKVDSGLIQLNAGLVELNSGISQLESGIGQIDSGIEQLEMLVGILDLAIKAAESVPVLPDIEIPDLIPSSPSSIPEEIPQTEPRETEPPEETEPEQTEPEQTEPEQTEPEETLPEEPDPPADPSELEDLKKKRDEYNAQIDALQTQREELQSQLDELYDQRTSLEKQQKELEENKLLLEEGMTAVENGFLELTASQLAMEQQFAAAESQLDAGEAQIEAFYSELDAQEKKIAQGWKDLEDGKQELADGWIEYEEGKEEARQELADALVELQDGAAELADAWDLIGDMTENEIMILDRTSNVGYNNLDSSSDIVQGVSRVFPVFFILVASLVCITTMTRMIDEERTQIGTLKALGYTSREIISKYMVYSGSGALLGCFVGNLLGSTIFPQIIWEAYCIMLYITPGIVLTVNWPLCIGVTVTYTAVLLFVTWYCCRKALEEEPAELIRPKAPDPGKKIFLEKLPFWNRISFLNKVTIRNIFRYRQRLAMMMLGIGGCTALLLTGFGLRDSIVNVVDYQFEDVTLYDLEVYFRDQVTEEDRADLEKELRGRAEDYMFYHQSSVDLTFDGGMKEIYMISAGEDLTNFIDLHSGKTDISIPGVNEVVLSVGVAEAMGIDVGDPVQMRNADMETLELTVSGIYDNHVYNYSIVNPLTIQAQWGRLPEEQMAFIKVVDDSQVHTIGADLSELLCVMNVSVSEDMADMVRNMMDALDLVVMVIVFCAGLLAVIVLYNLTNININERIREISTIKVLGFNASETAAYVFKENLTLTVAGSIFGLLLGYLLLVFVMSQIKIDMVWFKALIEGPSYVLSVVMTIFSAIAVDFIFYFKLEKINMAEALKSVE